MKTLSSYEIENQRLQIKNKEEIIKMFNEYLEKISYEELCLAVNINLIVMGNLKKTQFHNNGNFVDSGEV